MSADISLSQPVKASISVDGSGLGSLILAGIDCSNAVRGFCITSVVGDVPKLEITLNMAEIDTSWGDVKVILPQETRAALIALGWTPPEGE
jgi:hypothetical protein